MNNEYYNIMLYLIQIISIYNALMMGYNVKKIGINKYELTIKRTDDADIKLDEVINNIVSFNIISNTLV